MAFKQRSSGLPFKEMGSSPAKQAIGGGAGEAIEHHKKYKKGTIKTGTKTNTQTGTKLGPKDKYGSKSTAGKDKFIKQSGGRKVVKGGGHFSPKSVRKAAMKVGGKIAKALGGRVLGVAGMMMATSSKADQPNFKKGDTHYIDPKKKIDFTSED